MKALLSIALLLCLGCKITTAPAPFPPIPTIEWRLQDSQPNEADVPVPEPAPVQTPARRMGTTAPPLPITDAAQGRALADPGRSVKLQWTHPEASPGGYVYWGTESRVYSNRLPAGIGYAEVTGLPRDAAVYFAVSATNLLARESPLSNEVMLPAQTPPNIVVRYFLQTAPAPTGPWTEHLAPFLVLTNPPNHEFTRIRVERGQ